MRSRDGSGSSAVKGVQAERKHRADVLDLLGRTVQQLDTASTLPAFYRTLLLGAVEIASGDFGVVALYDAAQKNWQIVETELDTLAVGFVLNSAQELEGYGLAITALITRNQNVIGVIAVGAAHERKPGQARVQALHLLAAYAARVLSAAIPEQRNARVDAARRLATLELVFAKLKRIEAQTLTPEKLARWFLTILQKAIPFDHGTIFQRDPAKHFQVLAWYAHVHLEISIPTALTAREMPLLQQIVLKRKTIRVGDVQQETRWRAHWSQFAEGSWLGVPLVSSSKVVGIVALSSTRPNTFSAHDEQLAGLLATPMALMLQMAQLAPSGLGETGLDVLTDQVLTADEEERKRVSRELHDEAAQSLTLLAQNLEQLQADLRDQSETLRERARDSVQITRKTLDNIRGIATQLRHPTLDLLGLDGGLEQLSRDFARRSGIQVVYQSRPLAKLSDRVNLTLYRFVQEALTNVVKHAQATRALVEVKDSGGELLVSVQDDGKGFDPNERIRGPRRARHLGLLGIRERLALVQGQLEIRTEAGKGTTLVAHVPLPQGLDKSTSREESDS